MVFWPFHRCETGKRGYGVKEADYQKIAEAVNGYLSLFQSEELVQGQKEGESQGQVQAGALPGNILTHKNYI